MKNSILLCLVCAVVLAFVASAQEHGGADKEQMAKAMEAMKLAQPGPEHEMLAKLAGKWTTETRMWMAPGSEAASFSGECEAEMILGGRFLELEFTAGEGHMATEGVSIIGFDRRHKRFTQVGFDTWGTYYVSASGTYDEEANKITMSGTDEDPVMGHTQVYDFVVSFLDDDTWTYEVIFHDEAHTQGKGPHRMVEVNYTRAK